ncbi:MAG: APC family permease [Bacteroidia bacterium]
MNENQEIKQSLGLLDATMIVVGSMIGSGIFIVSAGILQQLGSSGWMLATWVLTGLLTLIAALSYGELSAMFPKAGGQYVYLREAYNPLIAFLYGWTFFTVIQTGTIAAVGVGFSKFAAYLLPALSEKNYLIGDAESGFKLSVAQLVSIVIIVFLTFINTKGIQNGKVIQTLFTLAKLVSLFGLLVCGFLFAFDSQVFFTNFKTPDIIQLAIKSISEDGSRVITETPIQGFQLFTVFAAAMVGAIFSSDAWNNVTFIAGEIKNPQRNIALSLFFGTLTVTVIYLLMNIMYLGVMPLHDIAFCESERVAVAASKVIFGNIGTYIIAIMIMISTFGCNNGLILSGARVYAAMAQDGLFFKKVGEMNEHGVPANGLWIQCIWASLLCLTGRYGDLLDYVTFAVLVFYILTIAGIFILRKKRPDAERPYKAFAYPVLPALYIVLAGAICIALLIEKPNFTYPGLGLILLGIPIYYGLLKK